MIKKISFLLGCFIIVSAFGLPEGVNNQAGLKSPVFNFVYWLMIPLLNHFGKCAVVLLGCVFIIISVSIKNAKS